MKKTNGPNKWIWASPTQEGMCPPNWCLLTKTFRTEAVCRPLCVASDHRPVRVKELPMLPSEVMAQLFRGQKLFSGNTVPKDAGGIEMMSVFFLFLSFLVSYILFSFTKACYSSSKSLKLGVLEESTSSPTYNPFWLSERPDHLSCRGPFWPLLS